MNISADGREKRSQKREKRRRDNRERRGQKRKNMMLDFVVVPLVSFVPLFVIARAARLVAISSKAH